VTVDVHYVLAAAGLLATDHPAAAASLLEYHLGATVHNTLHRTSTGPPSREDAV
jgi:hypothetical protein